MQFEGTVLYPQASNLDRESKYDAGHFAVKWDVNGDKVSTWHPRGEGAGQLRKGAKAKLDLTNGKWSVVQDSWNPADLVGGGQASQGAAPGSGGQATYAPAPRQQPLDVVGAPGREKALNAELDVRLKMMNKTVQAVTKSLTLAMKTMKEEGIIVNEPVNFESLAEPISKMVNTTMMGILDNRSYFEGGQSDEG